VSHQDVDNLAQEDGALYHPPTVRLSPGLKDAFPLGVHVIALHPSAPLVALVLGQLDSKPDGLFVEGAFGLAEGCRGISLVRLVNVKRGLKGETSG